ncbi:MAG TPA: PQQ-binding-like beta-propeller repeat protein, partial [Candidatus Sulfopaludibacter sp.]|nr:PQQ-binding-like beta-propeller repeat protein [Candidatus Sulfopaludibacter sp.]
RIGPIFTPPSLEGTVMRPSIIGGANWGGGALDPGTGMLYVKSSNMPSLVKVKEAAPEVGAAYVMGDGDASLRQGIPLTKPPYAHLTAIDLNQGEIAWRVPFGDNPSLRRRPALAGVKLPERLGASGALGAIVTKGGLIFAGGGSTFYAIDASNGSELWTFDLGRQATATPMTYQAVGRQFVVIASGTRGDATLTAFAF